MALYDYDTEKWAKATEPYVKPNGELPAARGDGRAITHWEQPYVRDDMSRLIQRVPKVWVNTQSKHNQSVFVIMKSNV